MSEPTQRRRARAMSPDERRTAIVTAALPLVEAHGAAVTTKQIAAAAGIAEGTVFRVFTDKTELLTACLRAVVLADTAVERLRAIDSDLALPAKLAAVADAVNDWVHRIWRYGTVLREVGYRPEQDPNKTDPESEYHPQRQSRYLHEAIATLFSEDGTPLRASPDVAARLFQSLILANLMHDPSPESLSPSDELIDLFLHGAVRRTDEEGT